jgi:pyruvate,water dikinase
MLAAYGRLRGNQSLPLDVAVRSSATAEDLPDASFAGQQETYLNVQGDASLPEHCRRSFASLFTDRAISYRVDKGFDHSLVALSIGVQRMVRSDLASAGVMFTIDTETGFRDAVLINASYGLGENVMLGSVNPDEYYVFKPTLKLGFRPILQKRTGSKEFKLIYDTGGSPVSARVLSPTKGTRTSMRSRRDCQRLAMGVSLGTRRWRPVWMVPPPRREMSCCMPREGSVRLGNGKRGFTAIGSAAGDGLPRAVSDRRVGP